MDKIEELILKATQEQKDEDEALRKLLESMHVSNIDLVIDYIRDIGDTLDDLLQKDHDQVQDIAEQAYASQTQYLTVFWLAYHFKQRSFEKQFDKLLRPKFTAMFDDIASETSKKLNSEYDAKHSAVRKDMKRWFKKLPDLMNLTTQDSASKLIKQAVREGRGMDWLRTKLSNLHDFSYTRARTTAITEGMRIYSASNYDSFISSDAVNGITWNHVSGVKNPRDDHIALDGVTVEKGELFEVGGSPGRFPRDPDLPAEESINCHCYIEPSLVSDSDLKGGE